MVIATQNQIEQIGTNPLPEAQLDRFIMNIYIGYPYEEEELGILTIYGQNTPLEHLETVVTLEEILKVQEEILKVKINQAVSRYIIKIAQESRKSKQIELGISPRGTLAIARVAKAWAYYHERDFVTPDDIKKILYPITGHRISPRADAKYENISVEDILQELLKTISVPE
jgi:MoxR-like ATPase